VSAYLKTRGAARRVPPRLAPEQEVEVVALRANGAPYKDIVARLGTTRAVVSTALRRIAQRAARRAEKEAIRAAREAPAALAG
jgi:transcriptional regulator